MVAMLLIPVHVVDKILMQLMLVIHCVLHGLGDQMWCGCLVIHSDVGWMFGTIHSTTCFDGHCIQICIFFIGLIHVAFGGLVHQILDLSKMIGISWWIQQWQHQFFVQFYW